MRAGVLWGARPCSSRRGRALAAQAPPRSGKDIQRGMCGVLPFVFQVCRCILAEQRVQNGSSNITVFVRL